MACRRVVRGCNSLADGPPWSVRNENDIDSLGDPTLRAQVDRGFDALVERGFEPVDIGPKKAPEARSVRNDAGFGVVLMVSWRGSDMWTVRSSSPSITFPGDEEYSQTRRSTEHAARPRGGGADGVIVRPLSVSGVSAGHGWTPRWFSHTWGSILLPLASQTS